MRRTIARVALFGGLFLLVGFIVVLTNQTAQLVTLATAIAPWLGTAVLWTLLALYVFCVAVPVYMLLSLPKPLRPPESDEGTEFQEYLERLRQRLAINPHLGGISLANRADIEAALKSLDTIAEERTKAAASQVFVTTAISQNGSLDSFLVLGAQSKLILEIARIYYQRPTVRDLVSLYSNVAATAFVAGELEDLDIAEQIQPVVAAAFGSAAGAVPGFGAATTLFINSVTTGAANAFLTLRVGTIAQEYCHSVTAPSRKMVRRSALVRATQLLGGIVLAGTRRVAVAIGSGSREVIGNVFDSLGDQIRAAGTGLKGVGAATASIFKPRTRPNDTSE